jgi:hypothetical protein
MSNLTSRPLARVLAENLQQIRTQLTQLDSQRLARRCGFLKRTPRKIPLTAFLLGLVALSAEVALTLERIAAVIGLAADLSYSKQALHKRINASVEQFLAQVATAVFGQLAGDTRVKGWLRPFRRVLLHDSTVEALPDHLANLFPSSGNQRNRKQAALKIQIMADLLQGTLLHCSLSGFTRNDQTASPDILAVAKPGDLILRDLGYFTRTVLGALQARGASFLSRFQHRMLVYDLQGRQLDLVRELKTHGRLDRDLLVGAVEQFRVRLVALPVPEALANERRRKARANQDGRYPPTRERLQLLGWNIFLTNVSHTLWPPQAVACLYRLRWRIEMIFKAWKSHLGLRQFNAHSAGLLRLSVMIKLLFCALVYRFCNALELLGDGRRHVSLLRLARIIGQSACLFAAAVVRLAPEQWLEYHLSRHLFYEQRKDRKNFFELLAQVCAP